MPIKNPKNPSFTPLIPKTSPRFKAAQGRTPSANKPKRTKLDPGSPRRLAAERRRMAPKTDIKAQIKQSRRTARRNRFTASRTRTEVAISHRNQFVKRKTTPMGPIDFTPGSGIRPPTPKELASITAMNEKALKRSSKRKRGS